MLQFNIMSPIAVPPDRHWMKVEVYHPLDGIPPAANLGKPDFLEICHIFPISPNNVLAKTLNYLPG